MYKRIIIIISMLGSLLLPAVAQEEQRFDDTKIYTFSLEELSVGDIKIKNNGNSVDVITGSDVVNMSSPRHFILLCKDGLWIVDLPNEYAVDTSISYITHAEKDSPWGIISGTLGTSVHAGLLALKEKTPNIKALYLSDIIGSNDVEMTGKAMEFIMDNNLSTYVPKDSFIKSGGVDLFMAGTKRYVSEGAKVFIHNFGGEINSQYGQATMQYLKGLYDRAGIHNSFFAFMRKVPSTNLYEMTPNELQQYNIINTTKDAFTEYVGGSLY